MCGSETTKGLLTKYPGSEKLFKRLPHQGSSSFGFSRRTDPKRIETSDQGKDAEQEGTFLLAQKIHMNTFQNVVFDRMGLLHSFNTGRNNTSILNWTEMSWYTLAKAPIFPFFLSLRTNLTFYSEIFGGPYCSIYLGSLMFAIL